MKSQTSPGIIALYIIRAGAILCGCVAAFIAFSPNFPVPTLGGGWQFGLNEATRLGVVGQPLTFTFGPF
ncbi:hypothetical protein, partial [Salmonella enterica]|uniref:hypothetical protein n=1 Tax=Salmonella enterica TaxID=28901 RepID=UPI003CF488EA